MKTCKFRRISVSIGLCVENTAVVVVERRVYIMYVDPPSWLVRELQSMGRKPTLLDCAKC